MAPISAHDLQKAHELEGAPDPFPSLVDDARSPPSNGASSSRPRQGADLNTSSEDAFPSLAPAAPAQAQGKAASLWASKAKSVKSAPAPPPKPVGVAETLSIVVGQQTDKDGKIIPLGAIMKSVEVKTGCSLEASTQMKTGVTHFVVKGANQRAVDQAIKLIKARLSKIITVVVEAPISTLGTIIGPKGTTLRSITDSTGCKIDIPKRDASSSTAPVSPAESEDDEDEDEEPVEPTVEITITGPQPSALEAQSLIQSLIGERTSKTTVRIKEIPSSFFPFIAAQVPSLQQDRDVKVAIPPPAILKAYEAQAAAASGETELNESAVVGANGSGKKQQRDLSIVVKGEKTAVAEVVETIRDTYAELKSTLQTLNFSVPKRQHRFLVGASAAEILANHGCVVELPSIEDPSDTITIRGPQLNLAPALTTVVAKANAVAVETVDLGIVHRTSDPLLYGKSMIRYLVKTGKLREISKAQGGGVAIYAPFDAAIEASNQVVVEVVGEDRAKVSAAKAELVALVKQLTPANLAHVEIDPLTHRFLIGKKGAKVNQFNQTHGVEVIFPKEEADSSDVLLVFSVSKDAASLSAADRKARDVQAKEKLALVESELLALAKDAADITTRELNVDPKWHRAIIGTGGSVLNALIGEDKLVAVKVGNGKDDTSSDVIVIRGPSGEVTRVEKEILRIVEDAENDRIINGHVAEFTVDRAHVGHLVGSSGANINKLRDDLGVQVKFDDLASGSSASASTDKKKKSSTGGSGASATCTITGRKEAVEEAKKRVLAQVEKLADETTISLTIPRKFHSGLIGSSGKYAIRLEERHGVKITFPKADRENSDQKPDEVIIRGGKKGVAAAKAELTEAAEYEKETGQTLTFTIPSRAVARVLGKAGSQITEIKEETGTQIDVDKADSSSPTTSITVRGTSKAIQAAKSAILAIALTIGEETTTTVSIENRFHRSLIGPGGSKLRELIVAAGGPTEPRQQAGLVSFPKSTSGAEGASLDEVRLRGEPELVKKIAAELERVAADLRDRVILGVSVPVAAHAGKIGRGGSALLELQKKTGTTIQFPGSRQYESFGKIENAEEFGADVDPKTIVKVAGPKASVEAAIKDLSVVPEAPAPRQRGGRDNTNGEGSSSSSEQLTASVSVPANLAYAVAQDKTLFRTLRASGVQVNNPSASAPPAPSTLASNGTKGGRIDDDETGQYDFQVYERYPKSDETVEWPLKSRSQPALDKAVKIIEDAIAAAKSQSKVGVLLGLPQSSFGLIVGAKGATVMRLRQESGADIFVSRDDSGRIEITGDAESVQQAYESIIEVVESSSRREY